MSPVPQRLAKSKPLVTNQHKVLGPLLALSSRLRDHIQRADDGVATAPDDIAVVLRILICSGRGNRFLSRAIRSLGVPAPLIGVSPATRLKTAATRLGVGRIPIPPSFAERIGGAVIPATSLAAAPFTSTSTSSWNWDQFVSSYSNKWGGTHVDDDIPQMLEALELHSPANWALPAYALRMAGVAVWEATQQVLRASVHEEIPIDVMTTAGGVSSIPGPGPDAHLLHLEYSSEVFETTWGITGTHRHDLGHWMVGTLGTSMVFQPSEGVRAGPQVEPQRLRTPIVTVPTPASDAGDLHVAAQSGPGTRIRMHMFNRSVGHEGERVLGSVSITGLLT